MSHRRAKRIRLYMKLIDRWNSHPINIRVYKDLKRMKGGGKLPTLKEMHRANVHADIPDPKPTGIL